MTEEEITEEEIKAREFAEEICAILRKNLLKVRIRDVNWLELGLKPGEIILTLKISPKMTNGIASRQ